MIQLHQQQNAEPIELIYMDIEARLMQNIARHLRDYGQPIASDEWQLQKMAEIGRLNKENIRIIAQMSGQSITAVERMLAAASEDVAKNLEPGLSYLARQGVIGAAPKYEKSKAVKQVMRTMKKQAKDIFNVCNTTMLYKARDTYQKLVQDTVSLAHEILNRNTAAVLTGAESRQQALRKTILEFNHKGISAFVDKRGREWAPEAYVGMAMRTTAGSCATEIQMARCDDYGVDLIEISSHAGARPKCAKDQGKIFDRKNKSKKYPHWNTSSYGEPDGILGINCNHNAYPYVEGISIRRYFPTEDMEDNDKLYKEIQKQRALERDVRKQKRECMLYDTLGDEDAFEQASVKLKAKEARLRAYVNGNDQLHRRRDREQVVGFDRSISSKASAANRKSYNDFVNSVGKKDAPSFTKYSQVGYNKSKEYKELKALAAYRKEVPGAEVTHYRLNEALHEKGLIKGKVVPVEKKQAYILADLAHKREPEHIMKRMLERQITSDEVQGYIDDALFCVSQFKGTRLTYYAENGVAVLTQTSDYDDVEWIAKTAWSKADFNEGTDTIMMEARKYVQS